MTAAPSSLDQLIELEAYLREQERIHRDHVPSGLPAEHPCVLNCLPWANKLKGWADTVAATKLKLKGKE